MTAPSPPALFAAGPETLERRTTVEALDGAVCVRLGVVGARGAVELAFTCRQEPDRFHRDHCITADGFEVHSRRPMYGDCKPDHENCWLIGGPCWHDGTTSWARETVLPVFLNSSGDSFWRWLEHEYASRFDEIDERIAEQASPTAGGAGR